MVSVGCGHKFRWGSRLALVALQVPTLPFILLMTSLPTRRLGEDLDERDNQILGTTDMEKDHSCIFKFDKTCSLKEMISNAVDMHCVP